MDQAKGLRKVVKDQAAMKTGPSGMPGNAGLPRVIAVTSGKGGVGKTNIVGNVAVCLSAMGKRVAIIDADVGLANIDIIFNLRPSLNIRHVISGEHALKEVMVESSHGVKILPGGSGFSDLSQLTEGEKLNLLSEFESLADMADIILVDTGAGISANVLYFNSACDEVVVVATREPTSITDAYAMMKVMSQEYGTKQFKLIVNMAESEKEAKNVYASLSGALDKFLKNVVLEYAGYIPMDRQLQKAVQKRGLVLDSAPDSNASQAMKKVADRLVNTPVRNNASGSLTFFMNKVIQAVN